MVIDIPTPIVAAGKDVVLPTDKAGRAEQRIAGCGFEVFEDQGHTLFVNDPQRLVLLLTSFFKEIGEQD
jgi:pimeloyl-ACP methyl ester carboxylesterase